MVYGECCGKYLDRIYLTHEGSCTIISKSDIVQECQSKAPERHFNYRNNSVERKADCVRTLRRMYMFLIISRR